MGCVQDPAGASSELMNGRGSAPDLAKWRAGCVQCEPCRRTRKVVAGAGRTFERVSVVKALAGRKVPTSVAHAFASGRAPSSSSSSGTRMRRTLGRAREERARGDGDTASERRDGARRVARGLATFASRWNTSKARRSRSFAAWARAARNSRSRSACASSSTCSRRSARSTRPDKAGVVHGEVTATNVIVGFDGTTRLVRPFHGTIAGKVAEPDWFSYAAPEVVKGTASPTCARISTPWACSSGRRCRDASCFRRRRAKDAPRGACPSASRPRRPTRAGRHRSARSRSARSRTIRPRVTRPPRRWRRPCDSRCDRSSRCRRACRPRSTSSRASASSRAATRTRCRILPRRVHVGASRRDRPCRPKPCARSRRCGLRRARRLRRRRPLRRP